MNTKETVKLVTSTAVMAITGIGTMEFLDDLDNRFPYIVYTGKMKKLKDRMDVCKAAAKFNIAVTTGFACGAVSTLYVDAVSTVLKSIIKK